MLSIIVAGILALPALLVQALTLPIVAILSVPALFVLLFRKPKRNVANIHDGAKHVIVTGGSSGIGLAIAKQSVKLGVSKVTILARNTKKLEAAKRELEELGTATVQAFSVDVSSATSLEDVAKKATDKRPDSVLLFCCAGQSQPSYFEDVAVEDFEKIVKTNQLGSIFTTRAFLPYMESGTICFCSSICGQVGVFGFSSYAPTKFAVRGFAEVLHAELCNHPVNVQVAYPPDTDTPGFELENMSKPEETRLISEQGGLSKPEDVARTMIKEATCTNPRFNVYFNFEGWMVATLTAGFSPVTTLWDAISQVAAMALFRFVCLFYLQDWWRMIRNYKEEQKTNEAKTK